MIGYSSARLLRSGLISFRIAGRSLTSAWSAKKKGTTGSVFFVLQSRITQLRRVHRVEMNITFHHGKFKNKKPNSSVQFGHRVPAG